MASFRKFYLPKISRYTVYLLGGHDHAQEFPTYLVELGQA